MRLITEHMNDQSDREVNIVIMQNSRIQHCICCLIQVKQHALGNKCVYFQLLPFNCQQLHATINATTTLVLDDLTI